MKLRLDNTSPSFKDLFVNGFQGSSVPENFSSNFVFTGSGKASLSAIIRFLREKKIIVDKMNPILVPQWIGFAVYQTILTQAFITKQYTQDVRVIIAYHQYGFPQNMDKIAAYCEEKKLVLIEDCAHVIDSKYKNIPLGTFGDFSIYSFSKFLFCFALGGMRFKDNEFLNFFENAKSESSYFLTFSINFFKMIDEIFLHNNINLEKTRGMAYSLYPKSIRNSTISKNIFLSKYQNEVKDRKDKYKYLHEQLKEFEFMSHLEEDVTPYAVPLLINKNRDKMISEISEKGVECGEYWFDTNRFIADPKYERCVLLPLHSSMTYETIDCMVKILKKYL
jgi:hypothetical protein